MNGIAVAGPVAAVIFDRGDFRVSGTVDKLGVPGAYDVMLFNTKTGRLIDSTRSGADGTYSFSYVKDRPMFAVAFDSGASPSNAAISDQLILESTL